MRAIQVSRIGEPPSEVMIDKPNTDEAVQMLAVALSPVDVAVAQGRFAGGHPPLPYLIGHEGVAQRRGGNFYITGGGLGITVDGLAAEWRVVPADRRIPIPAETPPAVVAALGTAGVAGWASVTRRAAVARGESVVIRGASGSAGRVALQAARDAGAARVIAVGRDSSRLQAVAHLCDHIVLDDEDCADGISEAAGGSIDVLVDFLWGPTASRALAAVRPDGRVVVAGGAAGPLGDIAAPVLLAKRLNILGYSNFGLSATLFEGTLRALVDRYVAGLLDYPVVEVPVGQVARAWEGTESSTGKYVIIFEEGRAL